MNKVLVLSCGTGGGHNSAAKAIVQRLNEKGVKADFKEYLEIINPKLCKIVNQLYIKSTGNQGRVFKRVYKIGEMYDKTKLLSPVYGLNRLAKNKLYQYIKKNEYDYFVTTHLFAAQALTCIKKEYPIHFIEIATDYTYIPFWKETNPDYMIIPHEELKNEFVQKGMPSEKIKSIGIPVNKQFSDEINRQECLKELGLNEKEKYILVMTGSMGFGNVFHLVECLNNEIEEKIIVVCGNNQELYQQLQDRKRLNKVIPIGFTNKIAEYMRISQMVLTKPRRTFFNRSGNSSYSYYSYYANSRV